MRLSLSLVLAIFLSSLIHAEVVVTESATGQPLPKASIFDKDGAFIGMTDDSGKVPANISGRLYPLNIRYVGYNPVEISSPEAGVVVMTESDYSLPEIIVKAGSRNLLYLQALVRSYATMENSLDTVIYYTEQIVDYVIPVGKAKFKGWKKARILAQKEYRDVKVERKKSSVDTMYYREGGGRRTTSFHITDKFKVPETILSGEATEYVKDGKYYPYEKWRATADSYIYERDDLADNKDHIFAPGFLKALGASAAQTLNEVKYKFSREGNKGAGFENLVEASCNWDMILKGKLFKKATEQNEDSEMSIYSEMFIIDRGYLTEEEAKELKNDPPMVDFSRLTLPEGLPEPPAEVINLKRRVLESR